MRGLDWFKLDSNMTENPKIIGVSLEARWAWLEMIGYCARGLTDGHVPEVIASRITSRSCLTELTRGGLIHKVDKDWLINDYLDHNPSREDIEKARNQAAARQKRYRDRNA